MKRLLCPIYRLRSHSINIKVNNATVILFCVKYWPEDITEWRPITVRRIGRRRIRWEDYVRADLEEMKIQNLSQMAVDRKAWKIILEHGQSSQRVVVPSKEDWPEDNPHGVKTYSHIL
jgi:hypothetical protein